MVIGLADRAAHLLEERARAPEGGRYGVRLPQRVEPPEPEQAIVGRDAAHAARAAPQSKRIVDRLRKMPMLATSLAVVRKMLDAVAGSAPRRCNNCSKAERCA